MKEFYQRLTEKSVIDDNNNEPKSDFRLLTRKYFNYNKFNSEKDHKVLQKFKKKSLRICPFDKGNGAVLMTKEQYHSKMDAVLSLEQFRRINLRKNAVPPNFKTDEQFDAILKNVKLSKGLLSTTFLQSAANHLSSTVFQRFTKRPILSTVRSMSHAVAVSLDKLIMSINTVAQIYLLR